MKISVIIPAYNHEKYIVEAITSVLSQSYENFELIIINDGSTDSTEKKILSIQDKRIRYISQNNSGAHLTINRGISLAQGEYISILNSDDIYLPKRLETCLKFLENDTNYSVVLTTVEGIDFRGIPVKASVTHQSKFWLNWYDNVLPLFDSDRFYPNSLAKNIMVSTSNIFARRIVFQECGGFKELRYTHDWDMLIRLSKRYKIHLIKEDLLKYRIHPENTIHESDSDFKVQFEVNWLVVENLKGLNADAPFAEILELLKKNRYLSFEIMFLLSLVNNQPEFYKLVDFNNPRANQLFRFWSTIREQSLIALQAQMQDLQTSNAWLTSQCEAWEKTATEHEQSIIALQAQMQDLQTSNAWLASQCEAWEKAATEREQSIIALQAQMQDLQTSNAWLASQRGAWEKTAIEREQSIIALQAQLQDLQTDKTRMTLRCEALEKTSTVREQSITPPSSRLKKMLQKRKS